MDAVYRNVVWKNSSHLGYKTAVFLRESAD